MKINKINDFKQLWIAAINNNKLMIKLKYEIINIIQQLKIGVEER